MQLSIWPRANPLARLRLIILLGVLAAVIAGTIAVKRIAAKAGEASLRVGLTVVGGRLFEGIAAKPSSSQQGQLESDAAYSWSLLKQLNIVAKAQQFYRDQGKSPTALADLTKYGISAADTTDPWNRPYQMHVLAGEVFVVQSTGPSGKDAVAWERPGLIKGFLDKKVQIFSDNLIVAEDLKGDSP